MPYTPHTPLEIEEMLKTVGAGSVSDLFKSIPENLRFKGNLDLPAPLPELELRRLMTGISRENRLSKEGLNFLGAGVYRHFVPSAVRELSGRSEFVTPYTPYQPEVSQGTLQAIFEYQSLICRLFDMDVSNASHYDLASALVDACTAGLKINPKRNKIIIPRNIHPEYIEILETVLKPSPAILKLLDTKDGKIDIDDLKNAIDENTSTVLLQFPNFFGIVQDYADISKLVHDKGALVIAIVPEPISLGILKTPGEWEADIAVGEGIGLGSETNFGGPTLGIFTIKEKFVRYMPGRVCGETVDADGKKGYVLTLSTREQHIRRGKATSNICSNEALLATTTAIYLSYLGKAGLTELSKLNAKTAHYASEKLSEIKGCSIKFKGEFFNEFVLTLPIPAIDLISKLSEKGIYAGVDLSRWFKNSEKDILISCTELNSKEDIDFFCSQVRAIL